MKNTYEVEDSEIIFRRARIDDNFEEIAALIYDTDPYIYPYWFKNDKEKVVKVLSKLIEKPGFFFNYENIYVAYDRTDKRIVGILVGLDKSTNLDYDYRYLESINHRYKFTIKNYIKELIKEVDEFEDNVIYISNVAVKTDLRGKKIGTKLLGYFIYLTDKHGYDEYRLDCLLHNLRAKNLYHTLGFKEITEITGFDGTNHSKVEVVSFKKLPKDYMYFPNNILEENVNKN